MEVEETVGFISFIVIVFSGLIILGWAYNNAKKKDLRERGIRVQVEELTHISGIPNLADGVKTTISVYEDILTFNENISLRVVQVLRVQFLEETQLIEKQKSVIKRAVVGGLLLGPAAAIVGGISGVGTKTSKKKQYFLSIDFVDKEGVENTALLISPHDEWYLKEFIKYVNDKIGYKPVSIDVASEEKYEI
jgi:hypothetical protein